LSWKKSRISVNQPATTGSLSPMGRIAQAE
jgi:hypothetical protein